VSVRLESVQLSFDLFTTAAADVALKAVTITESRLMWPVNVEGHMTYGLVTTPAASSMEVALEGEATFDFSSVTIAAGNTLTLIGRGSTRPVVAAPTATDDSTLILQHVSIDCITALRATRTSPPAGALTSWSMPSLMSATFVVSDVEIRHATADKFPDHEPRQPMCQEVDGSLNSVDAACFPDPCYSIACGSSAQGHCSIGACVCTAPELDPAPPGWEGRVTKVEGYGGTHCELECCSTWGSTHCVCTGYHMRGCHESNDSCSCHCGNTQCEHTC